MTTVELSTIAFELNVRSRNHEIGELQRIRVELKSLSRRPGEDIFRLTGQSRSVYGKYAFHYGGRSELQFNIGWDGSDGALLRHGVGFSFESSQALPANKVLEVLRPKARLFKEFLQLNPDGFSDMRMWHWEGDAPSDNYMPGPIPIERQRLGVFVFLGMRRPIDELDYELILSDFDRLLPLYRYVESGGKSQPFSRPTASPFLFRPGCSTKSQMTTGSRTKTEFEVDLRHNVLQRVLYERLATQYGTDIVGTEISAGIGTSIDIVVQHPDSFWFYEIKTYCSPRACIREALGQLLEYSFWPGARDASRLIVVGETAIDKDGIEYLERLRKRYSLPIEYEQVVV